MQIICMLRNSQSAEATRTNTTPRLVLTMEPAISFRIPPVSPLVFDGMIRFARALMETSAIQ